MAKLKDRIVKNLNIRNKRASFEYHLLEKYVAGLRLVGTEIKSLRLGKANMMDSYCYFANDKELFLKGLHISEYENAGFKSHRPIADRKLLLTKRELKKLKEKVTNTGLTIVPLRVFINDRGLAKAEISLAQGKKLYDKREDVKKRDAERDAGRRF